MLDFTNKNTGVFRLTLNLTLYELCKAATLGGYFIGKSHFKSHQALMMLNPGTGAMTRNHAAIGLRQALQQSYEREFPARYEAAVLIDQAPKHKQHQITYRFLNVWREKATW